MRKLIISSAVLAFAALLASATSGAAAAPSKAPLMIAMHDPGCHWFYVGGGPNHRKFAKSVTRSGPVTLPQPRRGGDDHQRPRREHQGRAGWREVDALKAKGIYHLTMVRQAADDNHLTLKVT